MGNKRDMPTEQVTHHSSLSAGPMHSGRWPNFKTLRRLRDPLYNSRVTLMAFLANTGTHLHGNCDARMVPTNERPLLEIVAFLS